MGLFTICYTIIGMFPNILADVRFCWGKQELIF